jgi:predicted transcriptional regulator
MSKEELVQFAMELQKKIAALPKPVELSEEQVQEKVEKARGLMVKGIAKQMKVSSKSYSYTSWMQGIILHTNL